jgi:hypothetical protein
MDIESPEATIGAASGELSANSWIEAPFTPPTTVI